MIHNYYVDIDGIGGSEDASVYLLVRDRDVVGGAANYDTALEEAKRVVDRDGQDVWIARLPIIEKISY